VCSKSKARLDRRYKYNALMHAYRRACGSSPSCFKKANFEPEDAKWIAICTDVEDVYLRAKQQRRPVLPRNHRQPMKRMTARMAVATSKPWKKRAVRLTAGVYRMY